MKSKILSVFIIIAMIFSNCLFIYAADNTASTIRLNNIQGTVSVKSKNGSAVTASNGMRLFSGYTVSTGGKSYAYLSLDSSKAAKLDQSSSAEIRQSGNQLQVCLKSGNVFFNITSPLASNESLNIRTSTMVTGIRGTSGIIRNVDENVSEVYILDGKVNVTATDPKTGNVKNINVSAGEMAVSEVSAEGGEASVTAKKFSEEDIPDFAMEEIAKSPELQERISEESGLSVSKIISNVSDKNNDASEENKNNLNDSSVKKGPSRHSSSRPKVTETEILTEDTTDLTETENITESTTKKYSSDEKTTESTTDTEKQTEETTESTTDTEKQTEETTESTTDTEKQTEETTESTTDTETEELTEETTDQEIPDGSVVNLESPSVKTLQKALERWDVKEVNVTGTVELKISGLTSVVLVIPKNVVLNISGDFIINRLCSVLNNGTLNSSANILNKGFFTNNGTFNNTGRVEGSVIANNGTGTIVDTDNGINCEVSKHGNASTYRLILTNASEDDIVNAVNNNSIDVIEVNNDIMIECDINNNSEIIFNGNTTICDNGSIVNNGKIAFNGQLTIDGTLNNNGNSEIIICKDSVATESSSFVNSGTINLEGIFDVFGNFNNNGIISLNGGQLNNNNVIEHNDVGDMPEDIDEN